MHIITNIKRGLNREKTEEYHRRSSRDISVLVLLVTIIDDNPLMKQRRVAFEKELLVHHDPPLSLIQDSPLS